MRAKEIQALELRFGAYLDTQSMLTSVTEKDTYDETTTTYGSSTVHRKAAASEEVDDTELEESLSSSGYMMTGLAGITFFGLSYIAMRYRS